MNSPHDATLRQFEEALATRDEVFYELTLFVSGASDLSGRAIANAKQLCEAHLEGRYQLSVIDVHEEPAALLSNRVFAAPTLVRSRPLPVRMLVGDLSRTDRVLVALDLPVTTDASSALS